MQDQPTTTLVGSRYEVIAGRFQLLAIGPTATSAEVEQAFTAAHERAAAPEQALTEARDKLLDPAQRLASELAYPLDGTTEQASAFYADLSGNAPTRELLPSANKLPPFSRANSVALIAARHAADPKMLVALVDAHAAIDAAAIFDILKVCRTRAAFSDVVTGRYPPGSAGTSDPALRGRDRGIRSGPERGERAAVEHFAGMCARGRFEQ